MNYTEGPRWVGTPAERELQGCVRVRELGAGRGLPGEAWGPRDRCLPDLLSRPTETSVPEQREQCRDVVLAGRAGKA